MSDKELIEEESRILCLYNSKKPEIRYEDGSIIIDHGDCREVFPTLDSMKSDPLFQCDDCEWVYIYALADPLDGSVRYIGKSVRPNERLTNHCNEKNRCHRTNWIQSLLRSGRRPVMGILDRISPGEDWQSTERAWIRYGRESGLDLVNETDGGDGVVNLSLEAKAKISRRFKGTKLSEEHRRKCASRTGIKHTDATKEKMSRAHKGRVFTEEWRKKLSEALMGVERRRKITEEQADEIATKAKGGHKKKLLAQEYKVSTRTIWLICSGRWCPTITTRKDNSGDA